MSSTPVINSERLSRRIEQMGKIGALPGGGVCRTALSDADRDARDLLKLWMQQLDLEIEVDKIGNMFGIYPGGKDAAAVMIGSHLDTVTTGGLYDGSLGVLAALEVIQTISEAGIKTSHPVILANFTNEEGVRFVPDMMGSLAYSGKEKIELLHSSISLDGSSASVKDELERIGYLGTKDCGGYKAKAFIELHIEQGPVLESGNIDIGVVEKVQGIFWTEYIFEGRASHAGTTPMTARSDAGYVASAIATYIRKLVLDTGNMQVGTVGNIELFPNLINVTAERSKIVVDLRNPDLNILAKTQHNLDHYIDRLVADEGLKVQKKELVRLEPVSFNQDIINTINEASKSLGYTSLHLTSGAGHDAQLLSSVIPSAMIFVPSKDGISHNVNEFSSIKDIEMGANVLLHSVLNLAL